jgi:hypothetical protein
LSILARDLWNEWQEKNKHSYGRECIEVAGEVMRLLDEEGMSDTHALVRRAGRNVGAGELSPYMAGFVHEIVSRCHSRGYEFAHRWGSDRQIYRALSPRESFELAKTQRELTERQRELTETRRELAETWRELTETRRKLAETLYSAPSRPLPVPTALLRENWILWRELLALAFRERGYQSAKPTPKRLHGLHPPWELEYQAAGLL